MARKTTNLILGILGWSCILFLISGCGLSSLHPTRGSDLPTQPPTPVPTPTATPTPTPVPTPTPSIDPAPGKEIFDTKCSICHALGNYDLAGFPDLSGKSTLIDTKFPTPTTVHNGQTLTTQERTDIKVFISLY